MRTLAVGDIHGCFRALKALAAAVSLRPDDTLITLGDYVNRGPDSRSVIDWLIKYSKKAPLVALRGNHEIMMLEARVDEERRERWLRCGGLATLESYSPLGDEGQLRDVPKEHWNFLENTRPWFETDSHFFVHANALPDHAMEEQPDYMLFWERFEDQAPHISGKIMVCGHTAQHSGQPHSIGHAVCIDTWVYGDDGWLTCLDTGSGRYWQANQRGETRSDWLQ